MAARIAFPEERSRAEDVVLSLVLLGMGIAGVLYLAPMLAGMLPTLRVALPALPQVPWPLLGTALVAVGLAWAVDRGAASWRRTHGLPA